MTEPPLASIIISSYNYARFVGPAIDSALAQTYPAVEVIVVDDGSADESRQVISRYGDRIITIFKENGGQGSSINAGFAASRGKIVIFLDSDDVLLPAAVERSARALSEPRCAKVHWPMRVIDEDGRLSGRLVPGGELADGDLLDLVLREGPDSYAWSATSGNAWSRDYLKQVLPMPQDVYRTCPDVHLTAWAPFFGTIRREAEPQSLWRVHGGNNSWTEAFDRRLQAHVARWEFEFEALQRYAHGRNLIVDLEQWRNRSWFHRIAASVRDIASVVPQGESFLLADEDWWETHQCIAGRKRIPFLEQNGQYWGPPQDDPHAMMELDRLRQSGATFLVIAWPAFWWLDHYREFAHFLNLKFRRVIENDRVIVFDLRS